MFKKSESKNVIQTETNGATQYQTDKHKEKVSARNFHTQCSDCKSSAGIQSKSKKSHEEATESHLTVLLLAALLMVLLKQFCPHPDQVVTFTSLIMGHPSEHAPHGPELPPNQFISGLFWPESNLTPNTWKQPDTGFSQTAGLDPSKAIITI